MLFFPTLFLQSQFLKISCTHFLRQNQKCSVDYSSCEKMIDPFVVNFKAMFSAQVKVRKKDFCVVLAAKRQKCPDRAPLKGYPWSMRKTLFQTLVHLNWLTSNAYLSGCQLIIILSLC